MRVLLITNDYPPQPGGIQQYLANIVARHVAPVRVLAPAAEAAGDDVVVRGRRSFMWPTPSVRRWVLDEVAEFEPEVVVFGAPHPLALLGPRLSAVTGLPYAVMTHGAEFLVPDKLPLLRRAVVEPIRQADVVFAVSDFTARAVERSTGRRVLRLGAGVDVERFCPGTPPEAPFVIGCLSRFVPRQRHGVVIEAAELLYRRGHDVRVLLGGSGRLESRLRRRAAAASVAVDFETEIPWDDLPGAYRRMSAFVMPARSRWGGLEIEGLGIVYLEAAASGLPVIAGRSGGAPETVVEGVTGWTATTADEIAGILENLITSGRAAEVGAAARRRAVEEFSWDRVMERWMAGLQAAVEEQP